MSSSRLVRVTGSNALWLSNRIVNVYVPPGSGRSRGLRPLRSRIGGMTSVRVTLA